MESGTFGTTAEKYFEIGTPRMPPSTTLNVFCTLCQPQMAGCETVN